MEHGKQKAKFTWVRNSFIIFCIFTTHNFKYVNFLQLIILVLELLGNGNLLEYLRKHDRVDEAQAKIWFAQLVSGVKYIHDMEIAHRDLKLSNLLLDMKQNIRITDFGFSTPNISWEEEIPNSGWPKVTDYRGSLCYMSPGYY